MTKQPTLEELIEAAKAQVEKFKWIIANYIKQNPLKAAVKQEEFATKLAEKEQHVANLENLLATRDAAQIEAERKAREEAEAKEAAREAELEAARQAGYEQAKKELEAERKREEKAENQLVDSAK